MRWLLRPLVVLLLCLCGCGSARRSPPQEVSRMGNESAVLAAAARPDKIDKDGVPVYYRDAAAPVGVVYRKRSMDDGHGC